MKPSTRRLRIAYLLEDTREPWGGVEMVIREANGLAAVGHDLTLYAKTPRPSWAEIHVPYVHIPSFDRAHLAPHDLIVGTFFPTVEPARLAGLGRAVHYCQGFEGDSPQLAEHQCWVDAAYRIEGVERITISPFLEERLRERYGIEARRVPYGVRADLYNPAASLPESSPTRIALIGPWPVGWKDIPTGVAAARRLHEQGADIELVRVSPHEFGREEREAWGNMRVEEHVQLPQAQMPDVYRSCQLFMGTSNGGAEGFFLPAMEAMACGLPIVLSDIKCFRHYDEQHDYASFVPPGDVNSFADALLELLENETLRAQRRARGLEVASRHSFEAHLEAIEDCFLELVPEGQGLLDGVGLEMSAEDAALLRMQRARFEVQCEMIAPDQDLTRRLRCAEMLVELDPQHVLGHDLRAQFLYESGDYEAALASFDRALELDPQSASLHRRRGQLLAQLGRMDDSFAELRQAHLAGQPGANICLETALVCAHRGRFEEMAQWIALARERQPLDARGQQLFQQVQQLIATSGFAGTAGR
jgi:glycosyltransferase involved in cell wall biosynthesis